MNNIPPGLLLDGLLTVLLVATIFYCFILNRRLSNIRDAGEQMKQLVATFSTAAEQAKAGIAALKKAAEEDGAELQEIVNSARALRDELAFLSESGESLANKLAGGRKSQTASAGMEAVDAPGEPQEIGAALEAARAAAEEGEGPDSEAERQLLQALRQAR